MMHPGALFPGRGRPIGPRAGGAPQPCKVQANRKEARHMLRQARERQLTMANGNGQRMTIQLWAAIIQMLIMVLTTHITIDIAI